MANTREKEHFLRFLRGRGQRVTGERLALFDGPAARRSRAAPGPAGTAGSVPFPGVFAIVVLSLPFY